MVDLNLKVGTPTADRIFETQANVFLILHHRAPLRGPPSYPTPRHARPTPPLVVVPWEEAWGPWPHAPDEDVERKTPFCTKRSRARRRTSSSTRESARIADYHPHHVVCAQNT